MRNLKITFSEWSQYTLAHRARSGSVFGGPLRFFRKTFFDQNFEVFFLQWGESFELVRLISIRADFGIPQVKNCLSKSVLFSNFPAMQYGIIPPMLVLCHTTWLTGRSLVHLVPEGQRSTERIWSIYRWYGSIPHGASGLLIGPRHRNRHVTCGKIRSSIGSQLNPVHASVFRPDHRVAEFKPLRSLLVSNGNT